MSAGGRNADGARRDEGVAKRAKLQVDHSTPQANPQTLNANVLLSYRSTTPTSSQRPSPHSPSPVLFFSLLHFVRILLGHTNNALSRGSGLSSEPVRRPREHLILFLGILRRSSSVPARSRLGSLSRDNGIQNARCGRLTGSC